MTKKKTTTKKAKKLAIPTDAEVRAEAIAAYQKAKALPLGSKERRAELVRFEACRDELASRRLAAKTKAL